MLHQTFTTHLRPRFIEARRGDSFDLYPLSNRFEDYTIFVEAHVSVIRSIEAHRISSFAHANACTNQTSWNCTKTTEHFPDVMWVVEWIHTWFIQRERPRIPPTTRIPPVFSFPSESVYYDGRLYALVDNSLMLVLVGLKLNC